MAGGNGAVGNKAPGCLGQIQQPQRIGDMRAAFADDFRQLRLGIAKIGPKPLIAARLLDRVEILALDVLDDRQFQSFAIIGFVNDDGNIGETRELGGAPTPLAGDDFIGVGDAGDGPDDDRLNNALFAD